ncbi:MAG: hypothetical protein GX270_11900 [Clostridiaceae bacterium]|nr:hypothetical protein [Clostridiaceae bacterium]
MLTGHPAHIDSSGTSAAKEARLRGSDSSTSQIHTLDAISACYRKALMVIFYSGDQLQNIGYNSIIENELFIWS